MKTTRETRSRLLRRGFVLEYITLGWNVAGVVTLAAAAVTARSVALAGFGLDSLIEIGASLIALGVSVSLDELAVGFSLGLDRLPIGAVIAAIALQALVAAQAGLRLGRRLSERLRENAERTAGLALALLGVYLIVTRLAG
jgi:divalent metal cation (Fe/Co/Zn/Cd) transporter